MGTKRFSHSSLYPIPGTCKFELAFTQNILLEHCNGPAFGHFEGSFDVWQKLVVKVLSLCFDFYFFVA